jgi:hypothetical protein
MKLWTLPTLFLIVGAVSLALGKPAFNKDFDSTYGVKKTTPLGKASCAACHIGKTRKLNPYGLDLQKAMKQENTKVMTGSVLKKVEGLDSDKDGKSNLDEIHAGTLPGDEKSN